jgi:hypothetical protein
VTSDMRAALTLLIVLISWVVGSALGLLIFDLTYSPEPWSPPVAEKAGFLNEVRYFVTDIPCGWPDPGNQGCAGPQGPVR